MKNPMKKNRLAKMWNIINLDYSRVEVAAKARKWPTKL
jgi:hypothetical protein